MPRSLRIEYPGAVYHVLCRGDRREAIFRADADRELETTLIPATKMDARPSKDAVTQAGPVGKPQAKPTSWLTDYSWFRLFGFLGLCGGVLGFLGGVMEGMLVQRFPSLQDALWLYITRSAWLLLPLYAVVVMRKMGKDGWLLRKQR